MFGWFRREPKTIVINEVTTIELTDEALVKAHDKRVTELLTDNNEKLQQIRDLKARVRELESIAHVG